LVCKSLFRKFAYRPSFAFFLLHFSPPGVKGPLPGSETPVILAVIKILSHAYTAPLSRVPSSISTHSSPGCPPLPVQPVLVFRLSRLFLRCFLLNSAISGTLFFASAPCLFHVSVENWGRQPGAGCFFFYTRVDLPHHCPPARSASCPGFPFLFCPTHPRLLPVDPLFILRKAVTEFVTKTVLGPETCSFFRDGPFFPPRKANRPAPLWENPL